MTPVTPITEAITNGFFAVDRNWTVKQWNKAAERLLDVRAEDIVGRNLWEKFAGIVPAKFYASYHNAFFGDIPDHFKEYWSEKEAWFDVNTYQLEDTLSVSFQSRKKSSPQVHPAEQLKILNRLYRYVTEITNDCLWEWNLSEKEIFWIDGGHKRVFGYPIVNSIVPQFFWEHRVHPDDKDRLLTNLQKILASGSVNIWGDEYRFRKANGSYAYVHDRAHIIYDKEGKASRMIGATQDITARKLMEIQLIGSERKLAMERLNRQKEITEAVISAQEVERTDIGKELHDNLNQVLGAAKLFIEMARTEEENREIYLEKASGYVLSVIDSIRRLSKNLIIPGMQVMDLFDSIKILLGDMTVIHPIKIEFSKNGIDERLLNKKLQVDIFRIVQEQFNNILKHAKATRAKVSLTKEDSEIILLITDNGIGYDMEKHHEGVGILNMKSRAESHQGSVVVLSRPGKGYVLRAAFPLK
jgi:PAS domain S-box-containing protein